MTPKIKPPFGIVLADPPWEYKVWSEKGSGRSASQHYNVMSADDICDLPVSNISAEDAVLFLWVTSPLLETGLEVIRAWGFEYKTKAFTWIKLNPNGIGLFTGNGYYTRANSEDCLLATRGNPFPVANHDVHQVILAPVMEHSRKPLEQYSRIERLYPSVKVAKWPGMEKKVELFARRRQPGWTTWGNEAPDGIWDF